MLDGECRFGFSVVGFACMDSLIGFGVIALEVLWSRLDDPTMATDKHRRSPTAEQKKCFNRLLSNKRRPHTGACVENLGLKSAAAMDVIMQLENLSEVLQVGQASCVKVSAIWLSPSDWISEPCESFGTREASREQVLSASTEALKYHGAVKL